METLRKIAASVRLCAALLLVLSACLVRFATQTKLIFYVDRRISYKELHALQVFVYIASAAAAYNVLHLLGSCALSRWRLKRNSKLGSWCYRYLGWLSYFLDQMVVYTTVAANSAAVEHALLAITGAKHYQWRKWCDKYTRFCFQNGGALSCGYVASALMVSLTAISAFHLFTLYSPHKFLRLKNTTT